MKMTIFAASFCFSILICGGSSAFAQQKPQLPTRPLAKITAKVVGEDRLPINNAKVSIGFIVGQPPGQGPGTRELMHEGVTDNNGVFSATDECGSSAGLGANKDGFYRTYGSDVLFKEAKNGRWEPWNPTIELVLKAIVNPIPMYAKRVETAIPDFNVALPYDLTVGDWVAPRGKGKSTDILFTAKLDQRSESEYDFALTVSFPNKGDGIQMFDAPLNVGSELKSPRYAPEEGYQPVWLQTRSQQPGQIERGNYALDGNRNYFIRVRTILDEKGKVKNATFGKIYGDFMNFTFYLNPTPNDRNMEFDPKRNLLTGLKDRETVTNP